MREPPPAVGVIILIALYGLIMYGLGWLTGAHV